MNSTLSEQDCASVGKKKTLLRRITHWPIWLVVVLLVLFALQVSILAFPQIALHNGVQVGAVVLYHDSDSNEAMKQLASDIDRRLQGSGFYDSTRSDRVFFFGKQGVYEFYVRLAFLPHVPQGFNLSIFGNSYISGATVAALAAATGGKPKYSIWEGNPAHLIAHELGHQYVAERIGRGVWMKLPHWKQEGLPEYIANTGAVREDSAEPLSHRIGVLINDASWATTRGWYSQDWDRIHYEAWLLVEYLLEVEERTLEDIIADSVTKEATYSAMMKWYESQRGSEESI